jgi:hypothetical protein
MKASTQSQEGGRWRPTATSWIHTLVDALGNPTAFCLTAGQAHDLDGADKLLPGMAANLLIAGKAFDADERAIDLLAAQNKTVVISPRANRKISQD